MNKIPLIAVLIFFLSCNKNSTELPPPKSNLLLKEKTCFYGATGIVLVKFRQDTTTNKEGKVSIEVINLTGSAINNCRLYIEMCDGEPSLHTCQNHFVYTTPQLQADKPDSMTLPFRNINLSTVSIVAGVVSTAEKSSIISNVYDGNYVEYAANPAFSFPATGHVKGVVFADGESIFRVSLDNLTDTIFYNITGKFYDTTLFNGGRFLTQQNRIAPFNTLTMLTLEPQAVETGYFKYADHPDLVRFGLLFYTPTQLVPNTTNLIDKVLFTLTKQ